jgi:hypothetical protein
LLLTPHLAHIRFLDEKNAPLSARIGKRVRLVAETKERLDTIPAVDRQTAGVLAPERGSRRHRRVLRASSTLGGCEDTCFVSIDVVAFWRNGFDKTIDLTSRLNDPRSAAGAGPAGGHVGVNTRRGCAKRGAHRGDRL